MALQKPLHVHFSGLREERTLIQYNSLLQSWPWLFIIETGEDSVLLAHCSCVPGDRALS